MPFGTNAQGIDSHPSASTRPTTRPSQSPAKAQDEPRRRKHCSNACLTCRKSKIKCDNSQPRCSNCMSRNVDCVPGEDRRRSSAHVTASLGNVPLQPSLNPKQLHPAQPSGREIHHHPHAPYEPFDRVHHAFSQAQLLPRPRREPELTNTQFISYSNARETDRGTDLSHWMDMAGDDLLDDSARDSSLFESLGHGSFSPYQAIEALPESIQEQTTPPQAFLGGESWDFDSDATLAKSDQILSSQAGQAASESVCGGGLAKASSPSADNDLTEQLASRMGRLRIAEDGNLRYYGATSNLHMLQHGLIYCFQPAMPTTWEGGNAALEHAGLGWTRDLKYEEHLTSLFFAWHNTFLGVVDESVYSHHRSLHRSGKSTAYCSPSLENTVLALGATYSLQRHPNASGDPAEFFARRAKLLVEIEMDSPSMATVQALATLSAHEAAMARDSRGWLYAGMAVQLLSDLGLHLDLDATCERQNGCRQLDENTNLRRTIFWATQALDTLWSAYSGRPASMRYDEAPVPTPQPFTTTQWKPYIDRNRSLEIAPGLEPNAVGATHVYVARLTIKMRKISGTLYTGPQLPLADAQLFATKMTRELQLWHECLPPPLKVDTTTTKEQPALPAVLMLHLQFHEAMIILHRPFLSPPDSSQVAGQSECLSENSGNLCEASARAICRLLTMYKHQWGLRYMHPQVVAIILSAALIHLHNSLVYSRQKGMHAHEGLSICVKALGELSYFNIGTRALETILSLKRDWSSRTFNQLGGKRLGQEMQRNYQSPNGGVWVL